MTATYSNNQSNEYLSLPSSEWRNTIPSSFKSRFERAADSVSVVVPDKMKWTTSVEIVDESKFILVGSGARQNNLFVIENTAHSRFNAPAEYTPPDNSLLLRSTFTLPQPIFHLSVYKNQFAAAGPEGCVQIYSLDKNSLGQKGKGLSHVAELTLGETSLDELRISPPGVSIGTVRVNHVELSPTGDVSTHFIATQGRKLYLADIEAEKVLGYETLGVDTVYNASFSPHQPTGTLICTGGTDKTLSIIDSRLLGNNTSSIVLKYPNAHQSAITDTKFNRFIPYWIASSSEDGIVKVWDIRFLAGPACKIDGHYGEVNTICWSTTHCDVIATGSSDRSWKSWSLDSSRLTASVPKNDYFVGCPGSEWTGKIPESFGEQNAVFGGVLLAEYQSDSSGPIIAIASSTFHADSFYSVSGMGEVICHTLKYEIFENITAHRFNETAEKDVETAIKSKDLAKVYQRIINISRSEKKEGRFISDTEKDLINLCKITPPIDPQAWSKADVNSYGEDRLQMLESFKSDLDEFSYIFPPGFGNFSQWTKNIPQILQLEYDLVLLKLKIVSDVENNNWKNIIATEETICECMELSSKFLDVKLLSSIIGIILSNSIIKGMNIISKFVRIISEWPKNNINEFSSIFGVILFPTMFECEEWFPSEALSVNDEIARQSAKLRQGFILDYIQSGQSMENPNIKKKVAPVTSMFEKRNSKISPEAKNSVIISKEFSEKRTAAIEVGMTNVRSIQSVIALEMKVFKIAEEVSISEWRNLDSEIIDVMQKWDLNTGNTAIKKTNNAGILGNINFSPYEKTLSFMTNRIYVEALMRTKKYEDFFATCIDIALTYMEFDSSRVFLTYMERDGFASYSADNTEAIEASIGKIAKVTEDTRPSGIKILKYTEMMITNVKNMRDPICMAIRITSMFMRVLELKVKKEIEMYIHKILKGISSFMSQFSANVIQSMEGLEGVLKHDSNDDSLKETAQQTHDLLRDAIRILPLSSDKKPTTAAEKAISGYLVHEEAYNLLDKLYGKYLKI